MMQLRRIYWLTLIVWLVGVLIHLVWYVLQMRGQPPAAELYTQLLFFQVIAFVFPAMPY